MGDGIMPFSVFVTLFVIMLGLTKLYIWIFDMTEPIYAIGAAALTLIALYLALLPGMKKQAEAEQKAEAEKKNKALKALHERPSVPKDDHPDTGTDEAFMAAFTASMIYHEIHGHHRSREERDYDGNWDAPDDDSYYADPYEERHDDDFF
ncbi:hypothetical protein [Megasphaera massiliensis]|uniref:hypothetical protein n=2 Tax=Megasphaera TaxID=906 RepID=UPI00399C295F